MKALLLLLFIASTLTAAEPTDQKLRTLYSSLDPTSVAQHLAFYDLYGRRPLGQQALQDAWQIMSGQQSIRSPNSQSLPFSSSVIDALISLVNKQHDKELTLIDEKDLQEIEKFSQRLSHHRLKGHQALTEEQMLQLPPEQIDLARGLFLSEIGPDFKRIRTYEAMLDMMALQVLARLSPSPSAEEKIKVINSLIFDEMGFRFPPKSDSTQDIDIYTHLPSVLDSHRGVCLGVSIIYIALAQRLDLSLEMITPPGHIYVRYRDSKKLINIETTARGIHVASEEYLGIDTCSLQERNIKEVIGLSHFNQAAVHWQKKDYDKALQAYLKAQPYLKEDCLLKELTGYIYLIKGNKTEGEKLLWEVKDHIPDYAINKNSLAEDYFKGYLDVECIKILYTQPDENRTALLAQKTTLEEIVNKYPKFRTGLVHLAMMWVKLHRYGEALDILQTHYAIDPDEPEVNYYLSVIYAMRQDFPNAWHHLRESERIVHGKGHYPKTLLELRRELLQHSPE